MTTESYSGTEKAHNAQNEITSISGAMIPTYDANGNLTQDEAGRQFVYDAWNRLVEVRDGSGETVKRYAYDGLHRRISETAGGVITDFYYSDSWQVLEERVGGQTTVQYVWSPVYVDALILRDRDSDGDGTLDQRLWVVQDANFTVTAVVDDGGNVVERYVYDPFGRVRKMATCRVKLNIRVETQMGLNRSGHVGRRHISVTTKRRGYQQNELPDRIIAGFLS